MSESRFDSGSSHDNVGASRFCLAPSCGSRTPCQIDHAVFHASRRGEQIGCQLQCTIIQGPANTSNSTPARRRRPKDVSSRTPLKRPVIRHHQPHPCTVCDCSDDGGVAEPPDPDELDKVGPRPEDAARTGQTSRETPPRRYWGSGCSDSGTILAGRTSGCRGLSGCSPRPFEQ